MKNILINGAPGTGKTIISRAIPYYIGHEGLDIEQVYTSDIISDIGNIENYAESEFVEYIQIHPSMTYEDIVYGIEVSVNHAVNENEDAIKAIDFDTNTKWSCRNSNDDNGYYWLEVKLPQKQYNCIAGLIV